MKKLTENCVVALIIGVVLGCRTTRDATPPVATQPLPTSTQLPPTPAQPSPRAAAVSEHDHVPHFQGEIGPLQQAARFSHFMYKNRFKVVLLEVWMTESNFDGDADELSYFVLWEECQSLARGEKPSSAKCSGTEYNIAPNPPATESNLSYSRGVYRLAGYFSISGYDGPHQGLMGTTLKPLRVEDVR